MGEDTFMKNLVELDRIIIRMKDRTERRISELEKRIDELDKAINRSEKADV